MPREKKPAPKKKRPSGGAALKASGKTAIQFGLSDTLLAELDRYRQRRDWSRAKLTERFMGYLLTHPEIISEIPSDRP